MPTGPGVDVVGNKVVGLQNNPVAAINPADGQVLTWVDAANRWEAMSGGSGTITSVTAGTGLSGGGSSGAVTISMSNTTVTPGSYTFTNITVNARGQITAASNGTAPADTTATVAAAGSSQSGATALTATFNRVTTGSGGVALPTGSAGLVVKVKNALGTTVSLYPANDGNNAQINALAANAALSVPAGSAVYLEAISNAQWDTIP